MSEVVYVIRLKKGKDSSLKELENSNINPLYDYQISSPGRVEDPKEIILPSEQRLVIKSVSNMKKWILFYIRNATLIYDDAYLYIWCVTDIRQTSYEDLEWSTWFLEHYLPYLQYAHSSLGNAMRWICLLLGYGVDLSTSG